jgi:hydrogenase maturation protease
LRSGSALPDHALMSEPPPRILVIGYGNPGRRDDGLGPALAARLQALNLPGVTVENDYQLSIEHAEVVARYDVVVFADAARDVPGDGPFYLSPLTPAPDARSFSHSLSPQAVLELAAQCFGARPRGWLLGIRPADLDSFGEGISPQGQENLSSALAALQQAIETGQLAG